MGLITLLIKKYPKAASGFFSLWKKLTQSAATKYPRITSFTVGSIYALLSIPNRLRDSLDHYPHYQSYIPTSSGTTPIDDTATNFFLRVILEHNYKTVVEIGTFHGNRIISLKKLIPSINALGVDIGPNFAIPFTRDNVNFSQFNKDFFSNLPTKSLIITNGTLTCMKIEEIKDFLSLIFLHKHDIALSEPCSLVETYITESPRRNAVSFYHSYHRLAVSTGFSPLLSHSQSIDYSYEPNTCESIYCNLLYSTPMTVLPKGSHESL